MNIDAIRQAFPEESFPEVSGYYNEYIALWKRIFENNPPWAKVKRCGLYKKRSRRSMKRLNAAKVLCDFFSDLTFSEQCEITVNNDSYQQYILSQLDRLGFWERMPELISNAYALGGFAIKIFSVNGKPEINYVHADRFLPTEWDGKEVTDGAFCSEFRKGSYFYTFTELHKSGTVQYRLFRSDSANTLGTQCPVDAVFGFPPDIDYESDHPLFAYFKPCVSNNAEYDTPLGMSIYANAIDTLEAIDVAFDSFSREFILGKKRIIVPSSSIQTVVDPNTGDLVRYFDADDEAFVALKSEENESLKVTDNTVELRVQDHVAAINALLNILCFQVGLSAGSLSFDSVQGIKTATEVISQDSKTARTVKSNKNLLTETIESVIHALISVGVHLGLIPKADYTVTVGWKDNIIIDDNTLIDNNIKLVQAGLKSKIKAIMEVQKCDEQTAQQELDRIAKEQAVTGLSVDDFMIGGEADDTTGDNGIKVNGGNEEEVIQEAEEVAGKSLNGAQTQSLVSIITQYQSGTLTIGQAINIISISIGVSKEEARKIIEGAE